MSAGFLFDSVIRSGELLGDGRRLPWLVDGLRKGGDMFGFFMFLGGGNWLKRLLLPERLWVWAGEARSGRGLSF
jgi:hypothetical protein